MEDVGNKKGCKSKIYILDGEPAGNRTLIEGTGILYSIH